MEGKNKLSLIYVPVPNTETAQKITELLIREKLVVCVNQWGPIDSTYFWEGKVQQDKEWILLLKAPSSHVSKCQQRILELHPYQNPAILEIPVLSAPLNYLKWVFAHENV